MKLSINNLFQVACFAVGRLKRKTQLTSRPDNVMS